MKSHRLVHTVCFHPPARRMGHLDNCCSVHKHPDKKERSCIGSFFNTWLKHKCCCVIIPRSAGETSHCLKWEDLVAIQASCVTCHPQTRIKIQQTSLSDPQGAEGSALPSRAPRTYESPPGEVSLPIHSQQVLFKRQRHFYILALISFNYASLKCHKGNVWGWTETSWSVPLHLITPWRKTPFRLCCLRILLTSVNLGFLIILWSWWTLRLFSQHYHFPSLRQKGDTCPVEDRGGEHSAGPRHSETLHNTWQQLPKVEPSFWQLVLLPGNVTKLRAGERSREVSPEVLLRTNHLRRARVALWLLKWPVFRPSRSRLQNKFNCQNRKNKQSKQIQKSNFTRTIQENPQLENSCNSNEPPDSYSPSIT